MKYIFLTILFLGLSCKNTKNTVKQVGTLETNFKVIKIENSKLKLKVQPSIKLDFEKNVVSGNAGCNNYSGKIIRNVNEISFQNIVATKMYCSNMNIEKEFTQKLALVTSFSVANNTLLLYNKSKELILTCTVM